MCGGEYVGEYVGVYGGVCGRVWGERTTAPPPTTGGKYHVTHTAEGDSRNTHF